MDGNSRDIGLLRLLIPVNQLIPNVKVCAITVLPIAGFLVFTIYGFYGRLVGLLAGTTEFYRYDLRSFNKKLIGFPYNPKSVNFVISYSNCHQFLSFLESDKPQDLPKYHRMKKPELNGTHQSNHR